MSPPCKILVVEDEYIVAMDLRSSLIQLGYEVVDCVDTGILAVESAKKHRPHLVLMDIRLRGEMDGIEAAEQLRQFNVPVVYLTAFSDPLTVQRANVSEPFGYVLKPFDDRELRIVVEMAIYRHRAQQEHEVLLQERAARAAIEKEHQWADFLAEASRELSSSLDVQATLDTVLGLAVPRFADWAAVHARTQDGVQTAAVRHAGEKEDLVHELLRRYSSHPPIADGYPHVMATGAPSIVREISDDRLAEIALDADHLRLLRAVGCSAHICLPLMIRGEAWGALTLASADRGTDQGADDIVRLEELARRCAMAVDNARLYQQAEAAIALRDDFLSIASHELRTPLAALQLTLQRLDRTLGMPRHEEVNKDLMRARRQIDRLNELMEKLLDVSRIGAGELELEIESIDLAEVARETLDRLGAPAQKAGSVLDATLPGELLGQWDRMRIEQIITNIVGNAIKFGGGKPIAVRLTGTSTCAELTVRDQGIGIAADKLPLIFNRFERGSSGRGYGGLGLGLFITRQIVEASGGTIEAESEVGVGSTFVVTLPAGNGENR